MTIILLLKPKARRVQSNWIGYIPEPKKARKPSRVDKRKQQEEKEKFKRLIRLRKGESVSPVIESIDLPADIQSYIEKQPLKAQESLNIKLYKEVLDELEAGILKDKVNKEQALKEFQNTESAKLSLESIYAAWQKAKKQQEQEDLILLLVASEDI